MKKELKINVLVILVLVLAFTACGQTKREKVNVNEFETEMNRLPDEQVVDVRTPAEFAKGHIKDAFNVDVTGPEFARQVSALDKSKPVMVYCLSGGRSAKAAEYMREQGFVRVIEMDGGIMKWNAARKPLTKGKMTASGMTPDQFKKQVTNEKLVLVDFHAPWCAPCKKMAPELQALEQEYADKLTLMKVNADDNRRLMDSLRIEAIPMLMIYRNGELLWSHSGLIEKEKVRDAIRTSL